MRLSQIFLYLLVKTTEAFLSMAGYYRKFCNNFSVIAEPLTNCSMFCCTFLYVHFSIAIILMGKRELIALLNLSSWCLVMVERLFLTVPRGCLQFVIVVFPDHTHLLLLGKRVKFILTDNCQKSSEKLKAILKNAPVLLAPSVDKEFKLAIGTSDVGAGSVLFQEDDNGVDHPVCYYTKKFNKHQRNYSTVEKECFSLILVLQHFEVYLALHLHPLSYLRITIH